ncbi:hypothetical protein [Methylomonas methanica]|uniref:Uncharacterized protein n=1 Tax=Methylomonas methanica (strain DSM 25384 / MC09) TaxID=857087 RepID=G0A4K7_METMM|nr:hypothetical protein [Methylomonas methanica]AEG01598.1 hypothetical protein Metme_3224 [Methylomonas methanica MC09]
MKKVQLLKTSIESLKGFRTELHDDMDNSKRKQLDQIIYDLECCQGTQISLNNVLILLGKGLALLPALEKIFDELSK